MIQISYEHLDTIDSTNNELKRRLIGDKSGDLDYHVLYSDEQTAGRGRSGHGWVSKKGAGIATSMMVYLPKSDIDISQVTLLCAHAFADALEVCGIEGIQIKWPNDLLLFEKKFGGILVERLILDDIKGGGALIIGVGINLLRQSVPKGLKDRAISLEDVCSQKTIYADTIIHKMWESFADCYGVFLSEGSLSFIRDGYNKRLININRTVEVDGTGERGTAIGIDERGRLLIDMGGQIMKASSKEVHIRGIYGYV